MVAAGLDGVRRGLRPPAPVNKNIYHLTDEESAELGIQGLPHTLQGRARGARGGRRACAGALGDHICDAFLSEKRKEWGEYREQVHDWEIEQYMDRY